MLKKQRAGLATFRMLMHEYFYSLYHAWKDRAFRKCSWKWCNSFWNNWKIFNLKKIQYVFFSLTSFFINQNYWYMLNLMTKNLIAKKFDCRLFKELQKTKNNNRICFHRILFNSNK